jgi:DNA polymerase III epsilon subunit-like protein
MTILDKILQKCNNKFSLSKNETKENIYQNYKELSIYSNVIKSSAKKEELLNEINNFKKYKYHTADDKIYYFNKKKVILDDEQLQVVTALPNSNYRIMAGAGSGKSTTLLCRIKYLVDNFASPEKILLMTFNREACTSLKTRITELFGFDIKIKISTIDSFCYSLKNGQDTDLNEKISLNELCIIGEQVMKDFSYTIASTYDYVFFDEFQDVNEHQFNILKAFVDNKRFLTVIGDDNQNIYQWRGTNNYFIINLEKILKNHPIKTFKLSTNYRSTMSIVNLANSSISFNTNRVDKEMIAFNKDETIIPELHLFSEKNEKKSMFTFVIGIINDLIANSKYTYDQFAILSSTTYELKRYETYFTKNKIPHISLLTDKANDDSKPVIKKGCITITTIYRAKGLEWDCVFLTGICDNFFPSHKNNNLKNIEEDRRLFYVGITRPKIYLYFIATKDDVPISRFLKELMTNDKFKDMIKFIPHIEQRNKELFDVDNSNNIQIAYSVIDIIKLLKAEDFIWLKQHELLPKIQPRVKELYNTKLEFNKKIKENYLESDFGEFCDRLITRKIMIDSKQMLDDFDAKFIINGIELTNNEMELYMKYNLKTILNQAEYQMEKIILLLEAVVPAIPHNDLLELVNICKKIMVETYDICEIRREFTYPNTFLSQLKKSIKLFCTSTYDNDIVREDVYNISLCRTFNNHRHRLVYKNVYDIFMTDFDLINERMNDYATNICNPFNQCKVRVSTKYKINDLFISLNGEIDLIESINADDPETMVDFKCSESEYKSEWTVQLLIYYSLHMLLPRSESNITKIAVFNILDGNKYTYDIPEDYNWQKMLDFIENLIKYDVAGTRNTDCIDKQYCLMTTLFNNYSCSTEDKTDIKIEVIKQEIFINQKNQKNRTKTLIFDLESNRIHDDILQLAYEIYDEQDVCIKKVNHYIKDRIVDNYLDHKISVAKLKAIGIDFYNAMFEFINDMSDIKTFVGHNVKSSDIPKIKKNIERWNLKLQIIGSEPNENLDIFADVIVYDTMYEFKKIHKGQKADLSSVYEFYMDKKMEVAHDASYDAKHTAEVYYKMISSNENKNDNKNENGINNKNEIQI